ncbi:MAG: DNA repair protein RecN [Anaerolineae bacterium]|nr:DNA repair protein RecN [Anaerolineae bacterium]
MLLDLDIRDLAIIDHLSLGLGPGFNVITGETGAGKSIVIDAVGLLLGQRADASVVRAGAGRALVSGTFDPAAAREPIEAILATYGVQLEPDEVLILGREVHAAGRSLARVNGRPVPVKALADIGCLLVDIHGQSDAASLMREAEHLGLLDRYARVEDRRGQLAVQVAALREVDRELASLAEDEASLKRRAELLSYAVEEIAAAGLRPEEDAELLTERVRQANGARLAQLTLQAIAALRGGLGEELEGAERSGLDLVAMAEAAVGDLARIDTEAAGMAEQAAALAEGLRELAVGLRAYQERLDFSPRRLEAVEERLALIGALKRKYNALDIPALLAHAERAALEIDGIQHADERAALLRRDREALQGVIGTLAGQLSGARQAAAERLARAVEGEMGALSLSGGRFAVGFGRREELSGIRVAAPGFDPAARYTCDETGADKVAFQVSLNPGEPLRPLAKVASGGEAARLMLALKGILSAADRVPTLIFDEIDAGIGGRVGAVVGEKLWGLTRAGKPGGGATSRFGRAATAAEGAEAADHQAIDHQVICVTHLPQVAAYGDSHFRVAKAVEDGRTRTLIAELDAGGRVEELAQMLGATTSIARENALQLLQQARQWKLGKGWPQPTESQGTDREAADAPRRPQG